MSGMMLELMKAALAAHPEFHVAGRAPADEGLVSAIRRLRGDVLVLMQPESNGRELSADELFRQRPTKVVTIGSDGRNGTLYELRPHATPLNDLSVDGLVDAIRVTGSDG